MKRRNALFALAAFGAVHLSAQAQPKPKNYRIGVLSGLTLSASEIEALQQGLQEHGYVSGKNAQIEWRVADGRYEQLPKFAAELVGLKVNAIISITTSATVSAKAATTTIPIVFVDVADPVASGLVRTLGRPGGNITGVSNASSELDAKRLELLKETLPSLKSIAILTNPGNEVSTLHSQNLRVAAEKLAVAFHVVEVHDSGELVAALTSISNERVQALVPTPDALLFSYRTQVVDLAMKARLPVVGWAPKMAEDGALLSYGVSYAAMARRAGYFVDKIFRGAKPSDLPVERPTQFELVINVKTAKALGIPIRQSILTRASQVIQ